MTRLADTNNTPATGAVAVFLLKELLVSAGWSVPRSSDGTTYNASGDEIAAASDLAASGAWVVVRSPTWGARTIEWCFQRGANNTTWRVKVSDSAGFSGGSPGATQTPSATDEVVIHGSGTNASPTYASLFGTDGSYRWSILAEDAGSYAWAAVAWPSGGGACNTLIFQDPLTGTETGDTSAVVFSCGGAVLGDPTTAGNLAADAAKHYGLMGSSSAVIPMMVYANSGGTVVVPDGAGTSPFGVSDTLLPVPYARRSGLGGTTGFKGFSSILRWNTVTRAVGDAVSVSPSTRNWVMLTDVALIWDGSVPVV